MSKDYRRTTPYQRICRAAARGTGCKLSADDVAALAADSAISELAAMDSEREELSPDEADHYECFIPQGLAHLADRKSCKGDGWYRCSECAIYEEHQEDK